MVTISHPSLPTTLREQNHGAILCTISTPPPNNYAPLCKIGTRQRTQAIALTLPDYSGDTAQIDVGNADLASIEAIEIAGIRYTPARTPDEIEPGQFFWNGYTNTVTIKFDA